MKLTRIALAGTVFGIAAVAGGLIALATSTTSSISSSKVAFSTARLHVLDDGALATLPDVDGIDAIRSIVGSAPLHVAASASGVDTWLVETAGGSVCVVAEDSGGYAATCGTMEQVATGQVVLRIQNRATDPSLFVGIASNDVVSAAVGSIEVAVTNNVWIAEAGPTDAAYTVASASNRVTVEMNISVPAK